MNINKSILILFSIAFIYTISLFIAPITLEEKTVQNLDGNANMIDFSEKWAELPFYHMLIYTFSDFNCHQKHERSYSINQNQMPVCARDVGVFIGISLGLFAMSFVRSRKDYKEVIFSLLPVKLDLNKRWKTVFIFILGAIFVLPLVLDGGIQLISSYESTNPLRTATGLLFGIAFSVFISSLLISSFAELSDFGKSTTR